MSRQEMTILDGTIRLALDLPIGGPPDEHYADVVRLIVTGDGGNSLRSITQA